MSKPFKAPKPVAKEPSTKGKILVRINSKTEIYMPAGYTEEDLERMKEKYKFKYL
jgi:hypothetical protein